MTDSSSAKELKLQHMRELEAQKKTQNEACIRERKLERRRELYAQRKKQHVDSSYSKDISAGVGTSSNYCEAPTSSECPVDGSNRPLPMPTNTLYGCGDVINLSFEQLPSRPFHLPSVPSCEYCFALRLHREPKGFCCSSGKVRLSTARTLEVLRSLFLDYSKEGEHFRNCVRTYNNLFAFTSFGVKADKEMLRRDHGIYTFRVQGQVYHFMNEFVPLDTMPTYMQLYFYDTEHEVQNRLAQSDILSRSIVELVMKVMKDNPYAKFFHSLGEIEDLEEQKIILKCDDGLDQRVYNLPTVSQVAAMWTESGDGYTRTKRDIVVSGRSGQKRKINYYHSCYDPLQYPLLFPFGEPGWHDEISWHGCSNAPQRAPIDLSISLGDPLTNDSLIDAEIRGITLKLDLLMFKNRDYSLHKQPF